MTRKDNNDYERFISNPFLVQYVVYKWADIETLRNIMEATNKNRGLSLFVFSICHTVSEVSHALTSYESLKE